MIAEVAFDAPVDHPFSYRVPPGWAPERGQRVLAPLGGAQRVGIVLGLRDGDEAALKPLLSLAEPAPVLFHRPQRPAAPFIPHRPGTAQRG